MESPRLTYHRFRYSDFQDYKSWYMDEKVMSLITGYALDEDQVLERFETAMNTNRNHPSMGWYVVHHRETATFIGIAKLTPYSGYTFEVGYGMLPPHWGLGYGTEILAALIAYARELQTIHALIGITHPENTASNKILENAGFSLEEQKQGENGPSNHYLIGLVTTT